MRAALVLLVGTLTFASGASAELDVPEAGFAFGRGGLGFLNDIETPRAIAGGVRLVSAGQNHTAYVTVEGELWTTGDNGYGALGDGTQVNRSVPFRAASKVVLATAGGAHTLFVKQDGSLWGMGGNWTGQLGPSEEYVLTRPVRLAENVLSAAAGNAHSLFVTKDRVLWVMGENELGQLGTGDFQPRPAPVPVATDVVAVFAHYRSSYYIKSDGTLWAMGANEEGQLGVGNLSHQPSPVLVASGVASVAAGTQNAFFIKQDGTLWGMGSNALGLLGDGTEIRRTVPVNIAAGVSSAAAGQNFSIFVKEDGSVWAMGVDSYGTFGLPEYEYATSTPVKFAERGATVAASVHGLLIEEDGILYGWGANSVGQLGDHQVAAPPPPYSFPVIAVSAGHPSLNLYVRDDGTVWAHSGGEPVQFAGINDVVAVSADSGGVEARFLQRDGTLWAKRGDQGYPQPIATDVTAVGGTTSYSIYLKTDGTLWGIGHIPAGILLGETAASKIADNVVGFSAARTHLLFVKDDDTLWGLGATDGAWEEDVDPDRTFFQPQLLDSGVRAVAAGETINLYVTTSGQLWGRLLGWGDQDSVARLLDTGVTEVGNADHHGAYYLKADRILRFQPNFPFEDNPVEEVASDVLSFSVGDGGWVLVIQKSGVAAAPVVTTQPLSGAIVAGRSAAVEVVVEGRGPLAFQWYKDDVPLPWARTPRLVIPFVTAADAGSYHVVATNADGSITSSAAVLTVVHAPTISAIADQTVNEDVATAALAFMVGDAETPVGSLVFAPSSSNPTLIPTGNIVLGGSGANRTVKVTPAKNQSGTATITLTVSDGVLTTTESFQVTVKAVNDAPTISAISDQTVSEDTATQVLAFTISDAETSTSKLTLSRKSSNTTLVPTANIVFGGSGANRTVKVTPAKNQSGTTTITLTVSDGALTTTESFHVTVQAVDDAPTISSLGAKVVTKNTSSDVIRLVVGDAETSASKLKVSVKSSNITLFKKKGMVLGGSGSARTLVLKPAKNRTGSATITLTVSDGSRSTKTSFKVTVNAANAAPQISGIRNQTVSEDKATKTLKFTVTDVETAPENLVLTKTSSNPSLIPARAIVISGTGKDRTVKVTPAKNKSGTATITLTLSDGSLTDTETFKVTVKSVNDAPTISKIAPQTLAKNAAAKTLSFKVTDPELADGKLVVTRKSSNTTLFPTKNLVLGGSGSNRTLTIKPATNKIGTATLTLTVSDGSKSTSMSFKVTVGSTTKSEARGLVWRSAGPVITLQPQDQFVRVGEPVVLEVATNDPDATYQWFHDDQLLENETSDTLLIPGATLADAGEYTVVVSDRFGSTTGSAAFVLVIAQDVDPLECELLRGN